MSKKRVFVGVKKLHYALLTKDDNTGVQYTAPSHVIGSVNVNIQDTTNSTKFFADDAPFDVTTTYGGATVSIETAGLSLEIQAVLLGHTIENGVLKMSAGDKAPYVAIMFESEMMNGEIEYVKLLKGKFKIPSTTHSTKTDNLTPNAITIEGDFIARDYDKQFRQIAHSDDANAATAIANWYNYVDSSDTTVVPVTPNP